MFHEAFDVLRIHGFTAENPLHFFLYRLHSYSTAVRGIPYIGLGSLATEALHRGNHTAVESIVVIGRKNIGFMVFFILHRKVQGGQPFLEEFRFEDAPVAAAKDVAAPADIDTGQVIFVLPVLGVQHRIHTGPIGTGSITEDAECRISPGIVCIHPFIGHKFRVRLHVLPDEVIFVLLIQGSRQEYCLIHEFGNLGQRIPEEAADTAGDIDSGTLQFRKGNRLQVPDLEASFLPYGADTEKVEEFRNPGRRSAYWGRTREPYRYFPDTCPGRR